MKSKFCFALSAITALTALALGSAAQAQSQGSWLVRGGITQLAPQVTSGNLTAPSLTGVQSGVSNSTQYSGGVTYMLSNSVAIDLPLALPFKHNLYGTGSIAGVGKIGDTKAIPATVMVQYRFGEASGLFRPYLGLGVTYAKFDGEHTTAVLSGLTGHHPQPQWHQLGCGHALLSTRNLFFKCIFCLPLIRRLFLGWTFPSWKHKNCWVTFKSRRKNFGTVYA